jgi:hypothetical protein
MKIYLLTHQIPHLFSNLWILTTHHGCYLTNFQTIQKSCNFAFYDPYENNMFVELCVNNYATFDGLVNGDVSIFKTLTTYNDNHNLDNVPKLQNSNINKRKMQSLLQ